MPPSQLVVVGLSHRTAPLEIREKLAAKREPTPELLRSLTETYALREALWISTCNRVELYASVDTASQPSTGATSGSNTDRILPGLRDAFRVRAGTERIDACLYTHTDEAAARHAFRVTSSLDSMVVGEPQILGQFKEAFLTARDSGTLRNVLLRCISQAFAVAKKVRSDTGIASGAVSISSIAVDLAGQIFGGLEGRHVLLVGAGKMGESAAKNIARRGAQVFVLNRSQARAEEVARACLGTAASMEELESRLVQADIVISSTGSATPILTNTLISRVVKARKRRPLFLIDIAVPRDIEAEVAGLENVFLYDIDDLQGVASANLDARRASAKAAETLVELEVAKFSKWYRSLSVTPTIVALRRRVDGIVAEELRRSLPPEQVSEAERNRIKDAIVGKLLHRPITELRRQHGEAHGPVMLDTLMQLFDLQEEQAKGSQESEAGIPREHAQDDAEEPKSS